MSYITFDYRCSTCEETESRFVRRSDMDDQKCPKHSAPKPMTRLPAGTRTTFRYADTKLKD